MRKKDLLFFLIIVLLGIIITSFCLMRLGNTPQEYTDIIYEYTSLFSSNKTIERNLLFSLIFFGGAICLLWAFLTAQDNSGKLIEVGQEKEDSIAFTGVRCLASLAAVGLILYGKVNPFLFLGIVCALILFCFDSALIIPGVVFYAMTVYAVYAVYRIYAAIGAAFQINSLIAAILSLLLLIGILLFAKKERIKAVLYRACMLVQILLPFNLLIYTASKYAYHNEIKTVFPPFTARLFIYLLIALFIGLAIKKMLANWNSLCDFRQIIRFGSCVSILGFNSFFGTGAIIPLDMHHPYENIIGFSQLFQLGQKPFSEFIPVSGMYSVLRGLCFQVFGNGESSGYYTSTNIFYLAFIILVLILCWAWHARLIGLFFSFTSTLFLMNYDRPVLILPIMLTLSLPQLIQKKNLWLMIWFMTSLLHGLYYPLYGAAVCIGFFPMAVWQAIRLLQSGEWRHLISAPRFWAGWLGCFAMLLLSVPLLIGTLRHMLAMSGQSVLADGISRFGQIVPDVFLSFLPSNSFWRQAAFYSLTWVIPALYIWYVIFLAQRVSGFRIENRKIRVDDLAVLFSLTAVAAMLVISYTFTFTRLEPGTILSRSFGPLLAGAVSVSVWMHHRCKESIDNNRALIGAMIMLCILQMSEYGIGGIPEVDQKLKENYLVPYEYVLTTEEDQVQKLGVGFIEPSLYERIESTFEKHADLREDHSFMAGPDSFGYYYLCGLKADGPVENLTIKSLSAADEAIGIARDNGTYIGASVQPVENYYLYHWIMTSGEYVWNEDDNYFVPNDEQLDIDLVYEKNRHAPLASDGIDVKKHASSLGLSMDSLSPVFEDVDLDLQIDVVGGQMNMYFPGPLNGNNADFLFLEFDDADSSFEYTLYDLKGEVIQYSSGYRTNLMKKSYDPALSVNVFWYDNNGDSHNMLCNLGERKLLIPLGAGSQWLLNEHNGIAVQLFDNGVQTELPGLKEIRFLKLREAGGNGHG